MAKRVTNVEERIDQFLDRKTKKFPELTAIAKSLSR